MSAAQQIAERLKKYIGLKWKLSGDSVVVEPPTPYGFSVSLTESECKWVVNFDGWHEHFSSESEALDCFAFGLSDQCRLRVKYRGGTPQSWTVEERTANDWREINTVGMLLFPFWRRSHVEYRQNSVICGPSD